MIPTIEQILKDLAAKQISIEAAAALIEQHMVMTQDISAQRSYFAAEAMNGIISNCAENEVLKPSTMATFAVRFADALIAELNKEV